MRTNVENLPPINYSYTLLGMTKGGGIRIRFRKKCNARISPKRFGISETSFGFLHFAKNKSLINSCAFFKLTFIINDEKIELTTKI